MTICDAVDPFLKVQPTTDARRHDSDAESDGGRPVRRSGLRNGGTRVDQGSDDELDM